jgi:hypothetical protein
VHAEDLRPELVSLRAVPVEHTRSAVERRERQQRARELHEQGLPLRKIGEQLGISSRQVGRDLGESA